MNALETPVIVGIAQHTQSATETAPLDPLGLMALAGRQALIDARGENLGRYCDTLRVINIISHTYRDVCGRLAEKLDISPGKMLYSTMSGNSPQLYINQAADDIAQGRSRLTLIAGAEAGCALNRARKGEIAPDWPASEPPEKMDGDGRDGATAMEFLYDLLVPACAYALFENALAHALGRSPEEHQQAMGRICEHLSQVAGRNPHAWNQQPATAAELVTPASGNRRVAFPYTLHMTANLMVDQAAAVVLTSAAFARELGIPEEQWVYPRGGASFNNIWYISQRPTLHDSPALNQAARLALEQAGTELEEIDTLDFYSCFPWAVEAARQELGISAEDPRDLSISGGLPYFGGPGSNYPLHAIAEAVEKIRNGQSRNALITALGWYNTKWSVGVYGSIPGAVPWHDRDDSGIQTIIDSRALPEPVEQAEGRLTVESYTILYHKKGQPLHATVLGRLKNGRRAWAFLEATPAELEKIPQTGGLIGAAGSIRYDAARQYNIFKS